MVAHPGLIQQLLADEQISLIDRAAVNRQRRGNHRPRLTQLGQQGIQHRANVALRGAVESGTVLEIKLLTALGLQPAQGRRHCCK